MTPVQTTKAITAVWIKRDRSVVATDQSPLKEAMKFPTMNVY